MHRPRKQESALFHLLTVLTCCALLASACSDSPEEQKAEVTLSESSRQCLDCHDVEIDQNHQLDCSTCHLHDSEADGYPAEHPAVAARPAHPGLAGKTCGSCHPEEIAMVAENPHYRLQAHIGLVRSSFGAAALLMPPEQIPVRAEPKDPLELAEDLLRRRCLRCHVYYSGDQFAATSRGTGCAACHLGQKNAQDFSHRFRAHPADDNCLSCHYGNHVGFDYYGRYEHDFNREFRTPYLADADAQRTFGIEYHQLEADLHQQAGMVCIDCHDREEVMGTANDALQCRSCHAPEEQDVPFAPTLARVDEQYRFTSAATGLVLQVPLLVHPAHAQYKSRATCQACHARWTFNDADTHLLRIDHDDLEPFSRSSRDGSSEVLHILSSHIDWEGEAFSPVMIDKFSGDPRAGIWLKGFGERRWEQVLLAEREGLIQPVRPIMNLHLSWIDEEEQVRFDNVGPLPDFTRPRPYTPHTTGHAGLFYEERLRFFYQDDKQTIDQ